MVTQPATSSIHPALDALDSMTLEVLAMDDAQFDRALAAVLRFDRRQAGREQASGRFDTRGHWVPDREEAVALHASARLPNGRYPKALRMACNSLRHCATLEGADFDATIWVKHWSAQIVRTRKHPLEAMAAYRTALKLALLLMEAPTPPARRRPRL